MVAFHPARNSDGVNALLVVIRHGRALFLLVPRLVSRYDGLGGVCSEPQHADRSTPLEALRAERKLVLKHDGKLLLKVRLPTGYPTVKPLAYISLTCRPPPPSKIIFSPPADRSQLGPPPISVVDVTTPPQPWYASDTPPCAFVACTVHRTLYLPFVLRLRSDG